MDVSKKNPSQRGLLGSEGEGMTIVFSVGKYLPVDKAKYHRTLARLEVKVKVKQSRYWPGVAQRVPGSSCSQIS